MTLRRARRIKDMMLIIFACEAVVFTVSLFVRAGLFPMPPTVELPLGGLNQIAVDARERIYCSSDAYARIFIYNTQGEYQTSIYTTSVLGSNKFAIDRQGYVHTGLEQGDIHRIYNRSGEMIAREEHYAPVECEHYMISNETVETEASVDYAIGAWSWLYPTVVRVDQGRDREVVVSQPLYLWIVKMPVPVMPIGALSLFAAGYFANRIARRARYKYMNSE